MSEEEKARYVVEAFHWANLHWQPWIGVMLVWNIASPGWTPNDVVDVYQCGVGEADPCVPFGGFAVASDGGRITTSILARRVLRDPFGEFPPLDCGSRRGRCAIYANDYAQGTVTRVPISFDPNMPIPPEPKVTISPAGPYRGDQTVKVVGDHFPPSASFLVGQCGVTEHFQLCFGSFTEKPVDARGHFEFKIRLARFMDADEFGMLDCNSRNVHCVIDVQSEGNITIDKELRFRRDGATRTARSHIVTSSSTARVSWAHAGERSRNRFAAPAASRWSTPRALRSRGWSSH